MSDLARKLREAAARVMNDGTPSQIVSAAELDEMADAADRLRRQRDNLLSYINGIARQTAEMVRANTD